MTLNFVKLAGLWYAQLPDYIGNIENLEMVSGADTMCEKLDSDKDGLVQLIVSNSPLKEVNYTIKRINLTEDFGADYYCPELNINLWLCNVTKHLFDIFPDEFWFKIVK